MPGMDPVHIATVKACPRCGEAHQRLVFRPYRRPPASVTHWAKCPVTLEPLTARVVGGKEKDVQ